MPLPSNKELTKEAKWYEWVKATFIFLYEWLIKHKGNLNTYGQELDKRMIDVRQEIWKLERE